MRGIYALVANASLTATRAQNFWIILGKYLNVKLTAHIIREDALQALSSNIARAWRDTAKGADTNPRSPFHPHG